MGCEVNATLTTASLKFPLLICELNERSHSPIRTQEMVALSGAHTIGGKGFGSPTLFDNTYYKILLEKPWSDPGKLLDYYFLANFLKLKCKKIHFKKEEVIYIYMNYLSFHLNFYLSYFISQSR